MSSVATGPASPSTHVDPAAAFVPVQTRSERPYSFEPGDFGRPSGREVNWKHTPIDRLSALFAEDVRSAEAEIAMVSPDDRVQLLRAAIGEAPRGEVFLPEDLASALAWQHAAQAHVIRIPASVELEQPVQVTVTVPAEVAFEHLVIEAAENSRATVVIDHRGEGTLAQNVEIIVREGASLAVIAVQRWADSAVHLAAHQARVDKDAQLHHVVVSLGGHLVRVNPSVDLAGAGSQGKLHGLSFADAGQHLESQVFLHHRGPHTTGDVLYKGALQGALARSVWIGDVLIGPDAVGTDSYEANRNLVLTDGARADSIPNLEIETGDIRGAGHASATGRFDDEQLFYLQARGITEDEARRLVVIGFLGEIVQRIGVPALEAELHAAIQAELQQESGA